MHPGYMTPDEHLKVLKQELTCAAELEAAAPGSLAHVNVHGGCDSFHEAEADACGTVVDRPSAGVALERVECDLPLEAAFCSPPSSFNVTYPAACVALLAIPAVVYSRWDDDSGRSAFVL